MRYRFACWKPWNYDLDYVFMIEETTKRHIRRTADGIVANGLDSICRRCSLPLLTMQTATYIRQALFSHQGLEVSEASRELPYNIWYVKNTFTYRKERISRVCILLTLFRLLPLFQNRVGTQSLQCKISFLLSILQNASNRLISLSRTPNNTAYQLVFGSKLQKFG